MDSNKTRKRKVRATKAPDQVAKTNRLDTISFLNLSLLYNTIVAYDYDEWMREKLAREFQI